RPGISPLSLHDALPILPSGVVIDVVDEGPGIAAGDRERVFDRFARGNNPAQTGQIPTGGTGLGLSIVRWAVTLHGGTVEVADTPDRKSTRLNSSHVKIS